MKVQSLTDEFNSLHAVSSSSDLARSSVNAELHFYYPFMIYYVGAIVIFLPVSLQKQGKKYNYMTKNQTNF
jgi:hypothetical protein